MFYLIWSDYTRLAKHIAAATAFGSSINRAAKLVALPADLIPRYEAAQDPLELDADTAQSYFDCEKRVEPGECRPRIGKHHGSTKKGGAPFWRWRV